MTDAAAARRTAGASGQGAMGDGTSRRVPLLEAVTDAIARTRIVAILRASSTRHLVPAAGVLVSAGMEVLEFPLTTPGALDAISAARAEVSGAYVGAGTVLDAQQARAALGAGAQFLVSPASCVDVIEVAVEHGVVALPGAFTPTEMLQCHRAGASHVKLFPAGAAGTPMLTQVLAPLPGLRVVPTGGVGLTDAPGWLAAGACALGVGSPLLGDVLETGRLDELEARAAQWRDVLR